MSNSFMSSCGRDWSCQPSRWGSYNIDAQSHTLNIAGTVARTRAKSQLLLLRKRRIILETCLSNDVD